MDRFERLVIEQIPRLGRYARALTGDAAKADDLVQDCLERALSRRRLWIRNRDIRPWLYTIMHNLFLNDVKREKVRARVVHMDDVESAAAVDASPSVQLEIRDLDAALQQLPVDQRSVVLLVGLEEMAYRDAARVLDVPIGTVMSRLSRGRERLRELLSPDGRPGLRRVK